MNSRMVFRTAVLAAALLLSTGACWAQGTAAAAPAAKVGVLNIRGAIGTTAEGKQAQAELQSQFAPRQGEIENMNKQIGDLQQRLQAGQGKLSPDEETRLRQQGTRLAAQLERKQTEYQEDVNSALGEVQDRVGRKMVDVLDRYARENGYSVILDTSAQNTPILYAATQVDVTADIVRLYDQAYPLKSGAGTQPKPTTPKPAAPATQPPAAKP